MKNSLYFVILLLLSSDVFATTLCWNITQRHLWKIISVSKLSRFGIVSEAAKNQLLSTFRCDRLDSKYFQNDNGSSVGSRAGAKGGQPSQLRRLSLPTSSDPYHQYKLKGALNPNFLNFTKNREKFCF